MTLEIFLTVLNLDLKMFDQGILTGLATFFSWLAMSILKFIITPSLMTAAGYEPWEILLVTFSGAFVGVMVFYYTGKTIFSWWSYLKSKSTFFSNKKRKAVVTPGRRKFIKYKEKYGFTGLLITSAIFSVPISALLGAKYFSNKPNAVLYLILSFVAWSCVLTFLSVCVKNGIL